MKLTIQYHADSTRGNTGDVQGVLFMGDAEPLECVGRFCMTSQQWEGFKAAVSLGTNSSYCRLLEPVELVQRSLDGLFAEKGKQ